MTVRMIAGMVTVRHHAAVPIDLRQMDELPDAVDPNRPRTLGGGWSDPQWSRSCAISRRHRTARALSRCGHLSWSTSTASVPSGPCRERLVGLLAEGDGHAVGV